MKIVKETLSVLLSMALMSATVPMIVAQDQPQNPPQDQTQNPAAQQGEAQEGQTQDDQQNGQPPVAQPATPPKSGPPIRRDRVRWVQPSDPVRPAISATERAGPREADHSVGRLVFDPLVLHPAALPGSGFGPAAGFAADPAPRSSEPWRTSTPWIKGQTTSLSQSSCQPLFKIGQRCPSCARRPLLC